MKTKFVYLVIIIAALCMGKANSQIVLTATRATLSEDDRAILSQHLSDYAIFKIDKRELIDSLYSKRKCQFQIHIDEQLDWTIDLEFNDMRAPDFRQTYTTDEGEFEFEEPFIVNTFKGKTLDGQIARFTIDENNFFGVILCDQYHYVMRPAKDYTKNSTDASFIVYRSSDVIFNNDDFDYINDAIEVTKEDENERMEQDMTRNSSAICNWQLKIAVEGDYQFYQGMGSDLTNAYNRIFSVLNIVEGIYESTFNMIFIVTYQNVLETNTIYTETNDVKLLAQFRDYWKKNRGHIPRNIAHLFTGKFFPEYGVSYKGIGNDLGYSLTRNLGIDATTKTTAHEIGHNLTANENPTGSGCNCGYVIPSIMCQGSTNQNLGFCGQSISEILPYIHSKSSDLARNLPNSLTLSGSLTGLYEATQTITSTQVINSGITSYKAGNSITLKPGFHAKSGSAFTATIDDDSGCGTYQPISVATWTNYVCIEQGLRFNVTNATAYSIQVYAMNGLLVYSGTGSITGGNPVTVWYDTSVPRVWYVIDIAFYNPSYKLSNSYQILVVSCNSSNAPMTPEIENDVTNLQKIQTDKSFDFAIYPNPNDGHFTIDLKGNTNTESYVVEIFNCFGLPVDKINCSANQESINRLDLRNGVYFVRVTMGNNCITKKLIVQ